MKKSSKSSGSLKNGKIKRKEQVHLLLSKTEKAALETHANRHGLSVTAAVRLLLAEKVVGFAPRPR